jgi:hypothetical protein
MATRISTRTIASLAAPADLVRIGKAVAMLDAIVFPDEWGSRYHSFNARWARGERVFSTRNGQGDFYFVLFLKAGAVLHGFAHESAMSPWSQERSNETDGPKPFPGIFDGFPKTLAYEKTAASFCADKNEVTFCAWWTGDGPWRISSVKFPKGKDPDGSEELLFILDGKPATYANWIKEYAHAVPVSKVQKLYAHTPLAKAMVAGINPKAEFAAVAKEAQEIGYPVA